MKKCGNCKNRYFKDNWGLTECCSGYELSETEEEEIKEALTCGRYEDGNPNDDEEYCPSSTAGDYGPGNPWDAPGMSIRDFI